MNTTIVKDQVDSWFKVTFSLTLLIFHWTVIGAIIVVTIIANLIN